MPIRSPSASLLTRPHYRLLFVLFCLIFVTLLVTTTHAYTLIGEREIHISTSEPSAYATYRPSFDVTTPGDLGGIVVTFCADSPIINDTDCAAPSDFNLTNALANLNLGDINLSDYHATPSQHTSSGTSGFNTVTLTPAKQRDVGSWDTITNNNVSLPNASESATFTADNNTLVLAHANGNGVTFVDSSDPNPANWTTITNNNVSLPEENGYAISYNAEFLYSDTVLVLVHEHGNGVTFVDSSDPNPANWTTITNNNVSLPREFDYTGGYGVASTSDDQVLVLMHEWGNGVTFVDSSDPNPANWTEITNNNVSSPGTGWTATFTTDNNVLVIKHGFDSTNVTFVDSSDPNPANWTEITNNNVSLPGRGFSAAFTADNNTLVLAHASGNGVTFVDSSDPNPANWTEITNNNVSLPGRGFSAAFTADNNTLVLAHANGNGVTFVDSSDPNPANWTEITNNNVSLPGTGNAATFTADNNTLVLGHTGAPYVTFVVSSAILGYEAPVSAGAGDTATFELVNARNPSSLGTFYARIYTYADPAHAQAYTLSNPSAGGSVIDAGGIALSTAELLTIESKVQERLTFCLFTDNLSIPIDYVTCVKPSLDPVLLGDDNGVLSPDQPSIANNIHYNITTNASAGATIRAKANILTAGSFSIDAIGDVSPGDGIAQASNAGTEQFGFCTFTESASLDTTLTPQAPYNHVNCSDAIAGQGLTNDEGAQFAFNEANLTAPPANPYGDSIAHKPAGDWSTGTIVFLANITTITEPGIYTTTMELIATGRY